MATPARILTSDELQSRWSDWANSWEIHYESLTLPVTQTLLTWSNLRAATSILEVACGSGLGSSMCNLQKAKTAQLTCIDLTPAMVERAIKKINDPTVKVLVANAEHLPFEDQTFDRYYASFCLHLVSDPDKMLKEAFRVLKPGGTVAFSVWGRRENCVQMTFLNEIAEGMGVSVAPAGPPSRSPFHLGASEEALRQRALATGFSKSLAFYQQHPTPSLDPVVVTDKMLAPPTVHEAFSKLTPEQQAALRQKLGEYTDKGVSSGTPISMEALILVATK